MTETLSIWDVEAARQARDEALERVHDAPWNVFAMQALRAVAQRQQVVTSDDVWAELEAMGIPEPGEKRACGPVMQRAVRSGLLAPLGFTQGRNPKHHLDVARTYRSHIYGRER